MVVMGSAADNPPINNFAYNSLGDTACEYAEARSYLRRSEEAEMIHSRALDNGI